MFIEQKYPVLATYPLVVSLVIGSLALSACQKTDSAKTPNPSPQTTQANDTTAHNTKDTAPLANDEIQLLASDVLTTKTERYQPSTPITGTLQVANQTKVQAVVNSQANQILVKVGDNVKKGQPLVTLNLEDSKNKLVQAQSDVIAAQAQANVAQSLVSRNKVLLDKGFVAEIEYERSLADAKAQTQAVNAKQAQLNIAKKLYGDMTITAPMSGMIASRSIEAGQLVTAGQTLMEIIDPTQLEFAASVPTEAQENLTVGQSVPFTVSNSPTKFVGQVTRIAPQVDANTRQMMIYIKVNASADTHQLRAGMFATGTIEYGQIQVGILVPSNAVMLDDMANKAKSASSTVPTGSGQHSNAQNNTQKGYVWLINQQHRLVRQPIEIIKRYDNTNQYLISGVEMGSLVVLVPLSADALDKKAVIKG